MIVSLGLFTIILFIATSAFLTVVNTDRKSRVVRISMDNLNLALENMTRSIKTGTSYYCGSGGEISGVQDCPISSHQSTLSFTEQDGITRATYLYNNGRIWQKIGAGVPTPITAPEIYIDRVNFSVQGSALGPGNGGADAAQPYVTIVVQGTVNPGAVNLNTSSTFKIQTVVTQRAYDN